MKRKINLFLIGPWIWLLRFWVRYLKTSSEQREEISKLVEEYQAKTRGIK